jgi:hypothetical protein
MDVDFTLDAEISFYLLHDLEEFVGLVVVACSSYQRKVGRGAWMASELKSADEAFPVLYPQSRCH